MKMRIFRFLLCVLVSIVVSGCLTASALADEETLMTPTEDDITEEEALDIAVAFFSKICGLDEETLFNAEWGCYFGFVSSEAGTQEPHWLITSRDIRTHKSRHSVVLSGHGELLYWEAHNNGGFYEARPDLLADSTPAEPLESDTQEAEIIQSTLGALADIDVYTPSETKELSFQTYFMYQLHFNQGTIPVWLVYVVKNDEIGWKAAYGYNGILMSIVPYEQDFTCYQLPDEDFWQTTFSGQDYITETQLLAEIMDGSMSLADRAAHTARWRPLVTQWIEDHPYYMNNPGIEYDITLANIYGIPDESVISQQEALSIAQDEIVRLGCNLQTIGTRKETVYYYVTDPQQPVWEIYLGRVKADDLENLQSDATNLSTYVVHINAISGMVLDSQIVDHSQSQYGP